MKLAMIGLAALGCLTAGVAAASPRASDVDYLRASRCKGIALGLKDTDTAGLDAFLKTQGRTRQDYILERAGEEKTRAERQAHDANLKDQLTAELNGACLAYRNDGGASSGAH